MANDLRGRTEDIERTIKNLRAAYIDVTIHAQAAFRLVRYIEALEAALRAQPAAATPDKLGDIARLLRLWRYIKSAQAGRLKAQLGDAPSLGDIRRAVDSLPAEPEQPAAATVSADALTALRELVALEDMQMRMAKILNDRNSRSDPALVAEYGRLSTEYARRKSAAWDAARAALARTQGDTHE